MRRDQQVYMIGRQHIGLDAGVEPFCGNAQGIEVIAVVGFGEETSPSIVSPLHDMLGQAG